MTVADEPFFLLYRQSGRDVLHDRFTREACGIADVDEPQQVDPMTAEALLLGKHAVACAECSPRPEG